MRIKALFVMAVGLSVACASSVKETKPAVVRGDSPHIELKLSHTVIQPGQTVLAKAYGRGDLKGGWRCTYQGWRTDESGWKFEGTEPKTACGEEGETWIWPDGPGRQFRFMTSGAHEICVQVFNRNGWSVGSQECARVDVAKTE